MWSPRYSRLQNISWNSKVEKDTPDLQVSDVSGFLGKGVALYLTMWVLFTSWMTLICFLLLPGLSIIHLIYPKRKWMMQLEGLLQYGVT